MIINRTAEAARKTFYRSRQTKTRITLNERRHIRKRLWGFYIGKFYKKVIRFKREQFPTQIFFA